MNKSTFNIKDFGAIGDGTFHPISEWIKGGKFDRGYASLSGIKKDYPKAKHLEKDSIDDMAWEKAKAQLPNNELINIYIPAGTYLKRHTAWDIGRSNINVFTDGLGKASLITDNTDSVRPVNGLTLNGNKVGVWTKTPWQQIDLFDTSKPVQGKNYLDLLDISNARKYFAGMLVFVRYGASYYAQEYGEHNKVTSVKGNRIYFERRFSRNYSEDTAPYHGELLEDFEIQDPEKEFAVNMSSVPTYQKVVTIGSYSFEMVRSKGKEAILKNSYKHKVGTKIRKGTKIYKAYGIMNLYNENGLNNGDVRENITISGLIISGTRKGLVADVAYNVNFDNCRFIRDTRGYDIDGGLSFEIDMSTRVFFNECEFISYPEEQGSQISRASGDVYFEKCLFTDSAPNFTEFNHNCSVNNSTINITGAEGKIKMNNAGIGIGASCTNIRVTDNVFNLKNLHSGMGTSDIQQYPQSTNDGNTIVGNTFYMNNCLTGIIATGGKTIVKGNKLYGGIVSPIAVGTVSEKRSKVQPEIVFVDNLFVGDLAKVMNIKSNVQILKNHFINTGDENNTPFGNLLSNAYSKTENISMYDNVFENWYFQKPKDFRLLSPLKDSDNFSNNKFVNCPNVPRDFTIDFKEYIKKAK